MQDQKINLPLRDWTVLSLRPHGQHAVAHCASELRGAKFIACPSMKLEAIDSDAALTRALACDYIIVTSPAAIEFAGQSAAFSINEKSNWFALGEASASAMKKRGIRSVSTPENAGNSESLLALDALQNLSGLDVGLITAPGGRGLIETTLAGRGAKVHVAHTYRRKTIPVTPAQMEALKTIKLPFAVLCSSHEVFNSFWQQLDAEMKNKMMSGLWVLSSTRLQLMLRDAGIGHATVSQSPRPDAMLAHLEYVQTQQVR